MNTTIFLQIFWAQRFKNGIVLTLAKDGSSP